MRTLFVGILGPVLALLVACARQPTATESEPPIRVAVAANFEPTLARIAKLFTAKTGVHVESIPGATGRLAAQIRAGAPFDLYLAADHATVVYLEREKRIVPGSAATYALGRLALYGPRVDPADGPGILKRGEFQKIAIANPEVAPYGIAARETMDDLGALEPFKSRIVEGENVGQALTFVDTGAADLAFLSYGQVAARDDGHAWIVPSDLHAELPQDLALIARTGAHPRAKELREFLLSPEIQALIEKAGYLRGAR